MVRKSKKYNDLMATARELFWKHGVKRVSIEEVCQKANVSKMTYYKHFPNKIELAKTIFGEVVDQGIVRFKNLMSDESLSPADKIKGVILMKFESTQNISPEFMQDFYVGAEPELQAFVAQKTKEAWQSMMQNFKKAQDDGIFRKEFNPELLLKIQSKLVELVEDPEVSSMFNSQQEMIMEFANLLVYGMIPHE